MNLIQQSALGLALASGASAATVFADSGLTSPLAIADHDATGILRSLVVSGMTPSTAYTLDVSLNIGSTGYGGYVGDIFAYLAHQTPDGSYTITVLLNRPGRSTSLLSGYDDAGLNIVLSDDAAHDIHTYQSQAYQTTGDGVLTGTWQPDLRLASPDAVTNASARAATTLGSLATTDPNGTWNLFVADMETGGTMQLNNWSIALTAVPEPASAQVLGVLAATALLVRRRRKSVA